VTLKGDFPEFNGESWRIFEAENEGIIVGNCVYQFRKIEKYKYTHVKVVLYNFWMFTNVDILRSLMLNLG